MYILSYKQYMYNRIQIRIYPNDINKSIELLKFHPKYIIHNSSLYYKLEVKKHSPVGEDGLYFKDLWNIKDLDKLIYEINELKKFYTFISEKIIIPLCSKWNEDLDIIYQTVTKNE